MFLLNLLALLQLWLERPDQLQVLSYYLVCIFKSPLYHLTLLNHLNTTFHPGRTPSEWHDNLLFFNNNANTMDFYIMIKDFFLFIKFQYHYRKCYGTELFNIIFSLLLISTWMLVTLISVQDQSLILFFVLYNFKCIG